MVVYVASLTERVLYQCSYMQKKKKITKKHRCEAITHVSIRLVNLGLSIEIWISRCGNSNIPYFSPSYHFLLSKKICPASKPKGFIYLFIVYSNQENHKTYGYKIAGN